MTAQDVGGIDRFLLLHGIAFSAGGLPLVLLDNDVGQINDHL
ncbi:hypothetical protein RCCS2_16416 [Roseobacter sp. CCS2]|nr:hypothetical protein RCCS2_16416 [Roseobacter sp. CCS2]